MDANSSSPKESPSYLVVGRRSMRKGLELGSKVAGILSSPQQGASAPRCVDVQAFV